MFTSRLFGGTPTTSSPRSKDRALVGLLEPGDHAHRRGLAAARGPEQRDELALGDVERDAVDGVHVAERFADPVDADRDAGLGHATATSSSRARSWPTRAGGRSRVGTLRTTITTTAEISRITTATAMTCGSWRGSRSCEYRYTGNVTSPRSGDERRDDDLVERDHEAQQERREDGRCHQRQGDPVERRQPPGAEIARGFLERRWDALESRHEGEDREGQRDDDVTDRDRER